MPASEPHHRVPAPLAAPGAHLVLDHIVAEHAREAAMLRQQRTRLVRAPQGGLPALARLDERIEAHLDGLAVAGPAALTACRAAVDDAVPGEAVGASFALGVLALRGHLDDVLQDLLTKAATQAEVRHGLSSAFGWVSAETLQGVVRSTLASPLSQARSVALAACRMHRVDPGPALGVALSDADPTLRAQAARAAGQLGRLDLLAAVQAALNDADPAVAYWAAWSACRLGDRRASLPLLMAASQQDGAGATAALALLMAVATDDQAQDIARQVSAAAQSQPTPAATRRVVKVIALLGDTRFAPWLFDRMEEPALARLAGEAFSWITGTDLAAGQLERLDAPALPESAADEADGPGIELDEDEGLPWPDTKALRAWWGRDPLGPTPQAQRLFMGQAMAGGAAQSTLQHGQPRQRAHAALLLATQRPHSVLFPVAAPSWRQSRWLLAA